MHHFFIKRFDLCQNTPLSKNVGVTAILFVYIHCASVLRMSCASSRCMLHAVRLSAVRSPCHVGPRPTQERHADAHHVCAHWHVNIAVNSTGFHRHFLLLSKILAFRRPFFECAWSLFFYEFWDNLNKWLKYQKASESFGTMPVFLTASRCPIYSFHISVTVWRVQPNVRYWNVLTNPETYLKF
jgi:hypothetical protein